MEGWRGLEGLSLDCGLGWAVVNVGVVGGDDLLRRRDFAVKEDNNSKRQAVSD